MASYTGSNAEGNKARTLAAERAAAAAAFAAKQEEIKQANQVKLHAMHDTFLSRNTASEDAFKASTVGLVSASDFKKKRLEIEAAERAATEAAAIEAEKEKKRKAKERKRNLKALSFSVDDEEGEEEEKSSSGSAAKTTAPATAASTTAVNGESNNSSSNTTAPPSKRIKLHTKDPTADTSFLPDSAREAEEAALRARLQQEWQLKQERMKQELVQITYSYWDGAGHRHRVVVQKGETIGHFLEKVRKDIQDEFRELRTMSSDGLMYVKEDLIIPHHYTFYDLIATQARGKSGPLFHFDVHDDVRMHVDASVEKDESHAGKVVTKAYYERNKNSFPASRWEIFDPNKVYEKYTIKGGEVHGKYANK